MQQRTSPAPIPAYALYGEDGHAPDGIHAETIEARSARHDWRIAPHRHATLYQTLILRSGAAEAALEGVAKPISAGGLVWVPPLTVHGYAFERGTVGIVLSVPAALLAETLGGLGALRDFLERPLIIAPGAAASAVCTVAEGILTEYARPRPGRRQALLSGATLIAIAIARAAQAESPGDTAGRRDAELVRRFLSSVEASYTRRHPLALYAAPLGVSVSHLSRLCRLVTGHAPIRLINERRLLEAKRELACTAVPVQDVADRLGFDSPAYFSRFFRARTGLSPRAFRHASGTVMTCDEARTR